MALATPRGSGALAVVRVSGPGVGEIVRRVLGPNATLPPPRRASLRTLFRPGSGQVLDQALITLFPAPASYTGEDMVEVSCHGGPLGPDQVVETFVEEGARRAEPGEFTRRAYLNGRMDLIEAEAVADLVAARSPVLRAVAIQQVEGGLSRRIAEVRGAILGLEAQLVHHLDFPSEDDAPVPLRVIAEAAVQLSTRLDALRATAPGGQLLREGALAVFAGRPNAGKSSLFNALLGEERAIVTSEPGTTRDAVEESVSIGGYPFRLVDTAGIREPTGEVERLGIEVARRFLGGADVVLYCLEAGRTCSREDSEFLQGLGATPRIVVRTQSDRVDSCVPSGISDVFPSPREVVVSSRTGEGIGELRDSLRDLVFGGIVGAAEEEMPVVTRGRQVRQLEEAAREINAFGEAVNSGIPGEVAAAHLKTAETALEELLGIIDGEEVLDRVFSDFCIGK